MQKSTAKGRENHKIHRKRTACGEEVGDGGAEERWRGAGAPLPTNGDAALPAPLTAQQGAHHMPLRWPLSYRHSLAHSRRAWVSRCGAAASLCVVPQGAASPCIAHEEPPSPVASRDTPPQKHGLQTTGTPRTPQMRLCEGTRNTPSYRRKKTPREHQKSIRRMRSVQDSVLPEGCGDEASPHISTNPQGEARNPQMRSIVIHRCAAS